MKSAKLMCMTAIASFAALAIPVRLAAQENQDHKKNHKDHHYKLIDLGTFGGPSAVLTNDCGIGGGGACGVLNNRGTVVSQADTSSPNPNYLNANPILPSDPFIFHAFRWHGGALQDLGTLPGGYNSVAQSISPGGLIAGASENGAFDPLTGWPEAHAVLWQNNGHSITDLGTLEGGYESEAFSVNDRAQVVGFALNTIPDPFCFGFFQTQCRAFLWQNGVMQDLGTLGTGNDAAAYFVNETGQVTGVSFTNTTPNSVTGLPTVDPFLWENGKLIDLGTLGGTSGLPNDLNNRGQVVGQSDLAGDASFHAFVWISPGPMQDLGTLGGANAAAIWINDAGDIVGASFTPTAVHAFLWRHQVMTDLGTVGGDPCTGALGINSKVQVVGWSGDCAVNLHAFLWENGRIIDLNAFNPPGSSLTQLTLAYNINDRGEIAGLGLPPGVAPGDVFTLGHTFVLIPCDENHPRVDGCDYTPVDSTTVPQTQPAAHQASGLMLSPIVTQRTSWYRHIASSGNAGNGLADDLLDGVPSLKRPPPPIYGYCALNTANNTLDGLCVGEDLFRCVAKYNPVQCPPGKKAKAPTNFSCAIGQVIKIDGATRCQAH